MNRAVASLLVALLVACRSRGGEHGSHGLEVAPAPIAPDPAGAHDHARDVTMPPSGYAPVTISRDQAAALQLATAPVEERTFTKVLRTVGVVTLDETRSAHVHSKVRGWIEGISVNFVGRKVHAGEPLCSIYSQEVYAAELEFLSILSRTGRAATSTGEFAEAEKHAESQLLDAARQRLSLWDVPKAEIARLEATREPRRTFPLLAPRSGIVVAKEAIEGIFIEPSLELYTLSDVSRVWVLADVYEEDVPYVHVGDRATLAVEGQDATIDAPISFLSPTIDEATRTLKARIALDNPAGRLRPGAFVSVQMQLPLGKGLAVAESAVIRTGTRSIVFVAQGDRFTPREVMLGPLVGDAYRVAGGLSAGDQVATGAQFLLDSESRLRATSAPGGGHVH